MTPTDPTTDTPLGLLLVDDHPVVRAGPVSYTHLTLPTILLV